MQPPKSQQSGVESFGQQQPYICMSSLYWCAARPWRSTMLTMSAVYITKRSGPSMDPRVTEQWTVLADCLPRWRACCWRSSRYERHHDKMAPYRPNEVRRRCSRMVWSTMSKAAYKSSRALERLCHQRRPPTECETAVQQWWSQWTWRLGKKDNQTPAAFQFAQITLVSVQNKRLCVFLWRVRAHFCYVYCAGCICIYVLWGCWLFILLYIWLLLIVAWLVTKATR